MALEIQFLQKKKMLEQHVVWLQAGFREWLNLQNPGCRSKQNKSTKNIGKNMANKDTKQGFFKISIFLKQAYIMSFFFINKL